MPEQIKQRLTSKWAYLAYGMAIGVLLLLAVRFATYSAPHQTHYHANFAVYINGQREEFRGPQYYQEVKLCSMHDNITPPARVHMHNQVNNVIHVHHDGVTWGQFFENLGWIVGPDFIRTPSAMYMATDTQKLNIVLNGDNLTGLSTITNQTIDNRDRLLVSFGEVDSAGLAKQYASVPKNAEEFNAKNDPAGCSGAHEPTVSDRFKNLF